MILRDWEKLNPGDFEPVDHWEVFFFWWQCGCCSCFLLVVSSEIWNFASMWLIWSLGFTQVGPKRIPYPSLILEGKNPYWARSRAKLKFHPRLEIDSEWIWGKSKCGFVHLRDFRTGQRKCYKPRAMFKYQQRTFSDLPAG